MCNEKMANVRFIQSGPDLKGYRPFSNIIIGDSNYMRAYERAHHFIDWLRSLDSVTQRRIKSYFTNSIFSSSIDRSEKDRDIYWTRDAFDSLRLVSRDDGWYEIAMPKACIKESVRKSASIELKNSCWGFRGPTFNDRMLREIASKIAYIANSPIDESNSHLFMLCTGETVIFSHHHLETKDFVKLAKWLLDMSIEFDKSKETTCYFWDDVFFKGEA